MGLSHKSLKSIIIRTYMYLDSIMIDGGTKSGQISTEEVMFDILLIFRYFLFFESFNDLVKVSFTGVLIQRL